MSHSKHKPKCPPQPLPPPDPPSLPRLGDLLWCRENKKRYALWWPAMVTYEPNLATLTRTNARGVQQLHVQYFGISAVRGWVSRQQTEPLVSTTTKKLPHVNLGKKLKAEYSAAVQEVTEALSLSHKERKLKFIFSFDSLSSHSQKAAGSKDKRGTKEVHVVKQEKLKSSQPRGKESGQKLGKRKRQKDSEDQPVQKKKNSVMSPCRDRRRRGRRAREMVVSLNISSLGAHTESVPSLLVSQPPVPMADSFAVTVDTALNVAPHCEGVDPSLSPTKRVPKPNLRYLPVVGRQNLHPEGAKLELAGPAKKLCQDPGSETGSEASGLSIASAILTPPSSCAEGGLEEDGGGSEEVGLAVPGRGRLEGEAEEEREEAKPVVGGLGKNKRRAKKVKAPEGPSFQDGVCAICDDSDLNLLACQGHCFQLFHVDCLGLIQPPRVQFVCDECQTVSKQCFVCSKSDGVLEMCSKPKCTKFYHRSCIKDNSLFVFDSLKTKFTCPLHSCAKCVCNRPEDTAPPKGSSLVQCIRCPLALHKPHCLIAGCNLLSPTQMICYLHLHIKHDTNLYKHINMDTCLECGASGSLYCCDFCSAAYHKECMEEHQKPAEEKVEEGKEKGGEGEKWTCPTCRDHDLPTYGSVVLCKFGVWRWWPAQVTQMANIPDNIRKKKSGEGMFVVRFCGTHDYCWIHHGRTLSFSLEPGADPAKEISKMCKSNKKAIRLDSQFKNACEEAVELYSKQMKLQEERRPQESKAYIKIRANKYLVPRPQLSDDLHSLPCHCTPAHPCDDDSICVNRAIHVECNPKTCPVGLFCHNQRMRQCQYPNTIPFYTGSRGWGLRAASDIEEGEFVVEYVGEVLDMKMCYERLQRAHENQMQHFYMLTLDSRNGLVIDAKEKSNHARFINHSCDPNCETQKWTVGHETRVGIFTKKFIKAGMELTFDYQLDSLGNGKKQCLCGSSNCSGYIGLRSKVEPKPKSKPKVKRKTKSASSHKAARPRPYPAPAVEISHENECFVCGDGGDLLCCDHGKCRKVYHLACIGRKLVPPEKWTCPRHFCKVCCKRAFSFCSTCPASFCCKHRKGRLVQVGKQLKCVESCCKETKEASPSRQDTSTGPANSTPLPLVPPSLAPPPLPPLPPLSLALPLPSSNHTNIHHVSPPSTSAVFSPSCS